MLGVPDEQTFGARDWWAEVTGQDVSTLGVKAGWDYAVTDTYLRTHVCVDGPSRSVVVLSATHISTDVQHAWLKSLHEAGPFGVLSIHRDAAGESIRSALRAAGSHSWRH